MADGVRKIEAAQETANGIDPTADVYFDNQLNQSNATYWLRMGSVDLSGKTVLDVGCGHGALSIDAARRGAKKVVGIDIDGDRIAFARINLDRNFPELAEVVSFHQESLDELRETFDAVVSKDSFEHIEDLPKMMRDIAAHLNPGGLLIVGFSPLYYSPFGDHGRYFPNSSRRLPWMPLIPEPILFRLAGRKKGVPIKSAHDVGLNKLTPAKFRAIVSHQGWEVLQWNQNQGDKRGMAAMTALAKVKPLEKYFTVSIYAILRKPSS